MTQTEFDAIAVTTDSWSEFAGFFEAKGGPSYCWCMAFRKIAPDADAAARKAEMKRRVTAGEPIGLIFREKGDAIGWCSIAPRDSYHGIGGPEPEDNVMIWTLGCLHLRSDHRRKGLSRRMIAAAERYARDSGADMIEATPVAPDSPSYRFMGRVSTFEAAGYEEIGMAGTRRHVMRKRLRGAA